MTLGRKTLGLFPLCLGLSLLWHFFGALAIGITPEPASSYAQVTVPTLALARPLEVLDVGLDASGEWIRRAVTSERDPEYFGFPRTWAFGKFQSPPDAASHRPPLPPEIPLPRISSKISSGDWTTEPLGFENPGRIVVPLPKIPLQSLAQAADTSNPATVSPSLDGIRNMRMVLHGPVSQRKCLIQVLPHFEFPAQTENRSLILGGNKSQEDSQGLRIRLWVSGDGNVRFVFLESSSGDVRWDGMALRAVQQWQFAEVEESSGPWQWGTVCLEGEHIR